jgi:hypothetical protein
MADSDYDHEYYRRLILERAERVETHPNATFGGDVMAELIRRSVSNAGDDLPKLRRIDRCLEMLVTALDFVHDSSRDAEFNDLLARIDSIIRPN